MATPVKIAQGIEPSRECLVDQLGKLKREKKKRPMASFSIIRSTDLNLERETRLDFPSYLLENIGFFAAPVLSMGCIMY
ncbi:hypothetical protein [Pseudomonas sp. PIC25]|uniref:hypothetical protein n=1 Tax=Pseudomonas sp. PIC25 TaxID=1958773 RepID=UPI00117B95C9|nr:hypothetical protein [Pseudomonas sp. PIC25]